MEVFLNLQWRFGVNKANHFRFILQDFLDIPVRKLMLSFRQLSLFHFLWIMLKY